MSNSNKGFVFGLRVQAAFISKSDRPKRPFVIRLHSVCMLNSHGEDKEPRFVVSFTPRKEALVQNNSGRNNEPRAAGGRGGK